MSNTKSAPQQTEKTVKVTLAKKHTHAGVDHPVGADLDVDEATAKWLRDNKVVAADPAKDQTAL